MYKKCLAGLIGIYIIFSIIFIYTLPVNFCKFITWLGSFESTNVGW